MKRGQDRYVVKVDGDPVQGTTMYVYDRATKQRVADLPPDTSPSTAVDECRAWNRGER